MTHRHPYAAIALVCAVVMLLAWILRTWDSTRASESSGIIHRDGDFSGSVTVELPPSASGSAAFERSYAISPGQLESLPSHRDEDEGAPLTRPFSGRLIDTQGVPCPDYALYLIPMPSIGSASRMDREQVVVNLREDGRFEASLDASVFADDHCFCAVVGPDLERIAGLMVRLLPDQILVVDPKGSENWRIDGVLRIRGAAIDGGWVSIQGAPPEGRFLLFEHGFEKDTCRFDGALLSYPPHEIAGSLRLLVSTKDRQALASTSFPDQQSLRRALRSGLDLDVRPRDLHFPMLQDECPAALVEIRHPGVRSPVGVEARKSAEERLTLPLGAGCYEVLGFSADRKKLGISRLCVAADESSQWIEWKLVTPGGHELDVRVLDREYRGVPSVLISAGTILDPGAVDGVLHLAHAWTDDSGNARLDAMAPGRLRIELRPLSPLGTLRAWREIEVPCEPIEIELPEITCLYLDPEGCGADFSGQATVHARHLHTGEWRSQELRPRLEQLYLWGLPPGATEIHASFGPWIATGPYDVQPRGEPQRVVLRSQLGAVVEGRLVGSDGPLVGRLVTVGGSDAEHQLSPLSWERTRTNEQGQFRLLAEPQRARKVLAWSSDGRRVEAQAGWSTRVELRIEDATKASGM